MANLPDSTEDCKAVSPDCPVENTMYGYAPNLGANAFYFIVFAICALVQSFYIVRYWRLWKVYSIMTCLCCIGESGGYAGRMLLSKNPWNAAALPIQFVLLMISPSFLAAALYTTMRTLVQHFGSEHTRLPARFWTWPFVTADMLGFFLQCAGGIIAAMGAEAFSPALPTVGKAVMIFGVSFQALIMIIAGCLATDFALRLRRRRGSQVFARLQWRLKVFLLSMMAAFFFVLTRCLYRIPELSGGVGGPLMRVEVDFMIFDGCLIMLAVVIQTVVHPGIFASSTRKSPAHEYNMQDRDGPIEEHEINISRRWYGRKRREVEEPILECEPLRDDEARQHGGKRAVI